MIRLRFAVLLAVAALVAGACAESSGDGTTTTAGDATTTTAGTPGLVNLSFEFVGGSDGWAADVSDFSDATRPDDVLVETDVAPPEMDPSEGFFHLAATNRSDDLFQFMSREVTDLEPMTSYEIEITVTFASNAPTGCAGVGGAPGESVWMKVGGSTEQPTPIHEDGQTRMSVDKGNQSTGGPAADVAGTIDNGIPCEQALEMDPTPWAEVVLGDTLDRPVTTTSDGSLWLLVGVDSGFEARTGIYYDLVEVVLTPVDRAGEDS